MDLFNAEQVARLTGAPYRQLLLWVDRGWVKPVMHSGTVRTMCVFSEAEIWEVAAFNELRRHFRTDEDLAALGDAIRRARGAQFIAAVRRSPEEAALECRPVKSSEISGLARGGLLFMLLALATPAMVVPGARHPQEEAARR